MILCDTNIIIQAIRGNTDTIEEINLIGSDNVVISVVTYAELLYGASDKKDSERIRKNLEYIRILPLNESISDIFIEITESFSLSHSIGIPDSLIAATAIYYDIELFTLNLKDFRFIPGLKLYSRKK